MKNGRTIDRFFRFHYRGERTSNYHPLDLFLLGRRAQEALCALHGRVDEIFVRILDAEMERRGSVRNPVDALDRRIERSVLFGARGSASLD